MNTLEKLHAIENKKHIYNIHYCFAGVGFIFYDPRKDSGGKDGWRKALSVEEYYGTFEKAVEGEYEKLEAKARGL